MRNNYFLILGLNPNGKNDQQERYSEKDIRDAYRPLTLKYHPDKNPDQKSSEQFEKITEAHKILSDAKKRDNFYEELENNPNAYQARQHLYVSLPDESFSLQFDIVSPSVPVSDALVVHTQIDLTELIESAGCSPSRLLKLAEKDSSMAQLLLDAHLSVFSLEEQFALFHYWYISQLQSDLDALTLVKSNRTAYAMLQELQRNRVYQQAFCAFYMSSADQILPDFFNSEQGFSYLINFSAEQLFSLCQKFKFLIPRFFKLHGDRLRPIAIIDLIRRYPSEEKSILTEINKVAPQTATLVDDYFLAVDAICTRKFDPVTYFKQCPKLLLNSIDLATELVRFPRDRYQLCLLFLDLLGEKIAELQDDQVETVFNGFMGYVIPIYEITNVTREIKTKFNWKIDLESQLPGSFNGPVTPIFLKINANQFHYLLKTIIINPLLPADKEFLLSFVVCFRGKEQTEEPFFLQLLLKNDQMVFTCLRANPELLTLLLQNKIYQQALKLNFSLLETLLPIIAKNKLNQETSVQEVLTEMKLIEKANLQSAAMQELHQSLSPEKFIQNYAITGFYPDLLSLETKDHTIIATLILDGFENMPIDSMNSQYRAGLSGKINTLLSMNISNDLDLGPAIREKIELVTHRILENPARKNFLLKIIFDDPKNGLLNNLIQFPTIWNTLMTGAFLDEMIKKVLSSGFHFYYYANYSGNITAKEKVEPLYDKIHKCKEKHELFTLIKELKSEESSLTKLYETFPQSELLRFLHLVSTESFGKKVHAFETLSHTLREMSSSTSVPNDASLTRLHTLISETGFDEITLDLLINELKQSPLLLNALFYEIETNYASTSEPMLKKIAAVQDSFPLDAQQPELFFLSTAELYLKKHRHKIPGDKLFLLHKKYSEQLDPLFKAYGLKITTIQGRRLEKVLCTLEEKYEEKSRGNRFNFTKVNEVDTVEAVVTEFGMLLTTPITQWSNSTPDASFCIRCEEFYAKLCSVLQQSKNQKLSKLKETYPENHNILLWALSTVIDNQEFPFTTQMIEVFHDEKLHNTSTFNQICLWIKERVDGDDSKTTYATFAKLLTDPVILKIINNILQGKDNPISEKTISAIILYLNKFLQTQADDTVGVEFRSVLFNVLRKKWPLVAEKDVSFFYDIALTGRLSFHDLLKLDQQKVVSWLSPKASAIRLYLTTSTAPINFVSISILGEPQLAYFALINDGILDHDDLDFIDRWAQGNQLIIEELREALTITGKTIEQTREEQKQRIGQLKTYLADSMILQYLNSLNRAHLKNLLTLPPDLLELVIKNPDSLQREIYQQFIEDKTESHREVYDLLGEFFKTDYYQFIQRDVFGIINSEIIRLEPLPASCLFNRGSIKAGQLRESSRLIKQDLIEVIKDQVKEQPLDQNLNKQKETTPLVEEKQKPFVGGLTLTRAVHAKLGSRVNYLQTNPIINGSRNLVGAIFKGIAGVMLTLGIGTALIYATRKHCHFSRKYCHYFFSSQSERALATVGARYQQETMKITLG